MMKEPCIDCLDKQVDSYGYFCDLACDKRTAWLNHQAGIKEVVEWINKSAGLEANTIDELNRGYSFIPIRSDKWENKLKEWGL